MKMLNSDRRENLLKAQYGEGPPPPQNEPGPFDQSS